jgi:Autophagy-related protein 27
MSRRRYQLRSVHLIYALVLFNSALFSAVVAQDDNPFDCRVHAGGLDFDLTLLAGEQTISREWETPPTTMIDTVRFDLCADLKPQVGVPESDQVCLRRASLRLFLWSELTAAAVFVGNKSMLDKIESKR